MNKKIVNISLIIAAVFLYLVASQISELVFDIFNLPITRDFWLTIPEMIAIGFAGLSFLIVSRNKTSSEFLKEVVSELSKVTYPTTKESGQSAVVVVVMVSIATVFLALYDTVWSFATQYLLTN
jgi:preprotein translocase subunit SecE